jgi:hypothetical protein
VFNLHNSLEFVRLLNRGNSGKVVTLSEKLPLLIYYCYLMSQILWKWNLFLSYLYEYFKICSVGRIFKINVLWSPTIRPLYPRILGKVDLLKMWRETCIYFFQHMHHSWLKMFISHVHRVATTVGGNVVSTLRLFSLKQSCMLKLFVRVSDLNKVTSEFNMIIFNAGMLLRIPIQIRHAMNTPFANAWSQTGVITVPSWGQFAPYMYNFVKTRF